MGEEIDEALKRQRAFGDGVEHQRDHRLNTWHPAGALRVGPRFFFARVGRVVRAEHVGDAALERPPERGAVVGRANGRVHLGEGPKRVVALRRREGEMLRR